MTATPFVVPTNKDWFDYLSGQAVNGVVDEANFWSPKALRPMKHFRPGDPVFLKLKAPLNAIVGYGFFAHFFVPELQEAWQLFGCKNGFESAEAFFRFMFEEKGLDPHSESAYRAPVASTILSHVRFWPRERWLPWGEAEGWKRNVVRGATEDDPANASRLLNEIAYDAHEPPEELAAGAFRLLEGDARRRVLVETAAREGQGTFRARLLDAYEGQCAITGEHTKPVLDAAHIQPYRGPRSNHVQNGLVLTKEFHTLFDAGLVTVTPDHVVRVSSRIREAWHNGHRYYAYDKKPLVHIPRAASLAPSRDALAWHAQQVFEKGA